MNRSNLKQQFALSIPDTVTGVALGGHVVSGQRRGALGGFVNDRRDVTLALTARHILEAGPSGALRDESGNVVALNAEPRAEFVEPMPFFRAIGLASVRPFIAIDDTVVPNSALPFNAHLLGVDIGIVRKGRIDKLGKVIGYRGGIRLAYRTDKPPQYFFDTLEVQSDSSQSEPTLPGDGGALCISETGSAVGIAIGAAGSRVLLAPIAPLIAERAYRFLTAGELLHRNLYARLELISRQQEKTSCDLDRARATLNRIEAAAEGFKQHFGPRPSPSTSAEQL